MMRDETGWNQLNFFPKENLNKFLFLADGSYEIKSLAFSVNY